MSTDLTIRLKSSWDKIRNFVTKYQSVLIILLFIVVFTISKCHNNDVTPTGNTGMVLEPLKQYTDKDGTSHAVLPTNVVSKDIMEYRLDSQRRALNASFINSMSKFNAKVETTFVDVPVVVPAGSEDSFIVDKSHPGYLKMITKGSTKTKQSSMTLELTDTITYTDYTKKRFLRSDLRNIDISNKNPYVKITHGSNLTLRQPKSIVTIGPSVGYGWALQNGKVTGAPMVGITATFNVFSIKTK